MWLACHFIFTNLANTHELRNLYGVVVFINVKMVPWRSDIIKPANYPFHGITYKVDVSWTESTELRKIEEILKGTRRTMEFNIRWRAVVLATLQTITFLQSLSSESLKICMFGLA